ncbi:hypothetical protein SAMN05216193_10981 [Pseudomonas jinjuensis]|uniref:Uncharacterized protein n=1 Tax=Pseudomonas jinjuensis TaxID=198616 RepID=A0A1H0HZL4_9PSED|nr:hypothetical protein SAMN05216193_10981 [Pseudomonas jinjuensis]
MKPPCSVPRRRTLPRLALFCSLPAGTPELQATCNIHDPQSGDGVLCDTSTPAIYPLRVRVSTARAAC